MSLSSWSSQASLQEGQGRSVRPSGPSYQPSHSPRPGSSPLARPQWPWTSHSHRPTSSSSPISISPAPVASSALEESSHWSGSSRSGQTVQSSEENSTRQWTFTAFEWTIRNVAALRDHVESPADIQEPLSVNAQNAEEVPDVLKESPMIGENGENKFKVEIARTQTPDERTSTPTLLPPSIRQMASTLSLYITSLFLDFAHPEYEFCAAIMVAIKCRADRAGERGARSDWVWEFWDQEFSFRKENEFWECQLPALSTLLTNSRIQSTDSFVLCIQIHSPIGPIYPQFPSAYYVPKDLLEGLESSLDNAYTGDVRFITVERFPITEASDPDTPTSRQSSSESSVNRSKLPAMARKRVLYAHSDVLKRRSEYFSTMLTSSFLESSSTIAYSSDPSLPPRKIHDIVVSEADFVTVYWLLKWIYADWLLFREEDDPRDAVEGMGGGWSIRCLAPATSTPGHGEWDWRRMKRSTVVMGAEYGSGEPGSDSPGSREWEEEEFNRSLAVRSPSVGSSADANPVAQAVQAMVIEDPVDGRSTLPIPPAGISSGRRSTSAASSSRGRGAGGTVGARGGVPLSPSSNRRPPTSATIKPVTTASTSYSVGSSSANAGTSSRTPISPHQVAHPSHTRNHVPQATPDPHPHPILECPPASALSIYQIAHRYSISGLQSLALEHMMKTINPRTAFPLLLATYVWDELHALVEDYIVEHFDAVSRCNVFEACCQDIATGEWGPEGGKTLAALFRRLASPTALRYGRA